MVSRPLKIFAFAVGARVCSAQNADNLWGASTEAPTVVPPESVVCPVMTALGKGSYLQTDLWSFMRTVNVRKKNGLMDEGYSGDTEEGGLGTTTGPTAMPQGADSATTPKPADQKIGRITAKFWAFHTEYELFDPVHNKLIASLVNPFMFWDTAQEFYDCQGVKVATVLYNYNFWDAIQGKYSDSKVLDRDRNHIATLSQDMTKSDHFFGERQYYLYLTDMSGTPLVSMRHPSQKWNMFTESQELDVAIETVSANVILPLPAGSPEFLTLVFANSLAMQRRFGPAWDFFLALIFIVGTGCLCCICLCSAQQLKDSEVKLEKGAKEEKEKLLDEKKGDKKSIWNCCSRPAGPSARGGAFYSTNKSSGETEFKTKVEGGLKEAEKEVKKAKH